MKIKKICICGVGGVGGYFGGKIVHKISQLKERKYHVSFLARGSHLEVIKQNGLELHTSEGERLICHPDLVSDDLNDIPAPDLCIICVKSYDLDILINNLKENLKEETIIIPLMNGIDIYERIRKNLKKAIVLPSCVYIGSHIEQPGLITQSGNPGFFISGPDPLHSEFNKNSLIHFFETMNIKFQWREEPKSEIWKKYLLVASFALVSAYEGQTLGEIIEDVESRNILKKIMLEIISIAEKKGITFPINIIDDTIQFCKDYPDVKPSYARDVEKGGKNEGDIFGGAIIRMGAELNIPTPIIKSVYKN